MKTISTEIKGNITVTENTTYHNTLLERVTVERDVIARFYGIIYKDIVVKEGAVAYIHGKLFGKVNAQGGTAYIFNSNGNVQTYGGKLNEQAEPRNTQDY